MQLPNLPPSQNRGSHNPFDHQHNPEDINLMSNPTGDALAAPQDDKPKFADRIRTPRELLLERIENDFTYHSPKPGQADRYALIRDTAHKLARVMVENCPPSRELSTALTSLETAVFNANASIARNE